MSFSNNNANFDLKGQKISLLNSSDDSNSLFSFESLSSSSIPIYGQSTSDDGPEGYFDSYWYACEFSRIINMSNYFDLFENITFGFKIKGYMYKLFTLKSSDFSISFGINKKINEQLNLAHYWIIILKYKRILFLAPLLFGLLGFFISLNINPIFQSQATLVIEESTKNIVNIEEVYSGDSPRSGFRNLNYINNQIQIIESDEVISSILSSENKISDP